MTTMILLMLWVYFCMYIILLGAEINEYYDERVQKGSLTVKKIPAKIYTDMKKRRRCL